MNGWTVRENVFIKSFTDYVVEVEPDICFDDNDCLVVDFDVIVCIGNGHEETKHTKTFANFEEAFKFVDEFSKQKMFDKVVEEHFKI